MRATTTRPRQEAQPRKALAHASENAYRERWRWDKVVWGTHCVDCYPGNCAFRVYVKDGVVMREEPGGSYREIEPGVPDMNPMGCQKGAVWGTRANARDRLLFPLKRVGKRGEGRWRRISWEQALREIADALLDAIEEVGPESIIHETTPAQGGLMAVVAPARFNQLLGGTVLDLEGMINDFNIGQYITFGKWAVSSADDWFHSDLIFIWHMNPVFTRIPFYHFIAEARYKGAEVIAIAPDFSPSSIHADQYVGLRPGSDAALALGMCRTIIDEKLYDAAFIREQTDLALLVRTDNRRFLRESDVRAGGRDDRFFVFDEKGGDIAPAPRDTLALGGVEPALEGRHTAPLAGGGTVEVAPVFELLKEHLVDYAPETASAHCGVAPDIIRALARKTAAGRTNILTGFNVCKYYHGDLMERALCLLLALTGNWGKKGTGIRSWSPGPLDGVLLFGAASRMGNSGDPKQLLGALGAAITGLKTRDDLATDEMAIIKLGNDVISSMGTHVPSSFFLYYQCGYGERWNRPEWHDPTMSGGFDASLDAAVKQWWEPVIRRVRDIEPRVLLEVGGNVLRRTRGGRDMLLKHLWPKLKMVATVDCRMSTTALYSDIVLPAADHHEKVNLTYTTPHVMQLHFADQAAAPAGESKPEWEIFALLSRYVQQRARQRELINYTDSQGGSHSLESLYDDFVAKDYAEPEKLVEKWVADSALAGNVPEGTTIETLRRDGHVRLTNWGLSPFSYAQASDLRPDETHSPYRWHVEKKLPYPTLTRRAQFYIDHEWFIAAGEALPAHKDNPKMGGDYPLELTSGHNRWSIHSQNVADPVLLQTHRGQPQVWMNPADAHARGIRDGEDVRAYNDAGDFIAPVKLAPAVRPGQVICYNGWEPYMFPGWRDPANVEPGMVKPLHLAAGYGHLSYRAGAWQIVTVDRGTRLEVVKAERELTAAAH